MRFLSPFNYSNSHHAQINELSCLFYCLTQGSSEHPDGTNGMSLYLLDEI